MRQNWRPHRVNRTATIATMSKHIPLTAQASRIHREDETSSWPQSIEGVNFSNRRSPCSAAYRPFSRAADDVLLRERYAAFGHMSGEACCAELRTSLGVTP